MHNIVCSFTVAGLVLLASIPSAFGEVYSDSFESGISDYWIEDGAGSGTIEITTLLARTGDNGLFMDQDNEWRSLHHSFDQPTQGILSVWVYFPETADSQANVAQTSSGFFGVESLNGANLSVEFIWADIDEGYASGQAHGSGTEIDLDREWDFGPGWHELKIQVDDTGARGWLDGTPLPHVHPALTECASVSFGIGWGFGGAAVYDDFRIVPEPSTAVLLSMAALGFFLFRRRR